LFDILP
jgi:hypothetical protein